jgi:hypothetical protein
VADRADLRLVGAVVAVQAQGAVAGVAGKIEKSCFCRMACTWLWGVWIC